MTVYVDDMRAAYGRMKMCHMLADTDDELHAMADRIGVARRWFQNTMSGPHYDIALSKRALAVSLGAREISVRQAARMTTIRRGGKGLGQLCKFGGGHEYFCNATPCINCLGPQ